MALRVTLVALCAGSASSAVIGIDFGARFVKVGIIQPGVGIELVLNEASKRKSSTAAGFNSAGERIYADDSFNMLGKMPEKQFVYQKLLLGKNVSHPDVLTFAELGYPYKFITGVMPGCTCNLPRAFVACPPRPQRHAGRRLAALASRCHV